jgi:hypothetical protein
MNRYEEIQGAARDVADWVCADPADRNRMADDLIRLVTLIVAGVGKSVAVDGESNISHGEDEAAHARYITGERIMDGAREMAEGAAGADLERYERDGLKPAWTSTRKQSAPAVIAGFAAALVPAQAPSGPTYGCSFDGDSWAPEHIYSDGQCMRCSAERCECIDEGRNVGCCYGGCV